MLLHAHLTTHDTGKTQSQIGSVYVCVCACGGEAEGRRVGVRVGAERVIACGYGFLISICGFAATVK